MIYIHSVLYNQSIDLNEIYYPFPVDYQKTGCEKSFFAFLMFPRHQHRKMYFSEQDNTSVPNNLMLPFDNASDRKERNF
jgi:hypothetical protein